MQTMHVPAAGQGRLIPVGPRSFICSRAGGGRAAFVRPLSAAAPQQDDFFTAVGKLAKRIQGALPVVGLLSRLTATDGGFDELAYPEYSRKIFDTAPPAMSAALQAIERKHGKLASSRGILLMLWMINNLGLATGKEIVSAGRRLRVTQDIEIEIERHQGSCVAARKKFEMMAPPEATLTEKSTVAVDAICAVALGLKDGMDPAPDDAQGLVDIIVGGVPSLTADVVRSSIQSRSSRGAAYL